MKTVVLSAHADPVARPRLAPRKTRPAAAPKLQEAPAFFGEPLPAAPASSNKLFYRINEAAKMAGLRPSVLRYWESEFRELHPEKDASDQRRYRQADIEVVMAIRKLLYTDRFTIKGARARLRDELRRQRNPEPAARIVEVAKSEPRPSVTDFRMQSARAAAEGKAEVRKRKLDRTLNGLRAEVNMLLGMLS